MANKFAKTSMNVRKLSIKCHLRRYDFPKEKPSSFPTIYNSNEVESKWYEYWEKNNFFKPDINKGTSGKDDRFSIVLPPPNVTGTLHLGHALTITVQDILARWHRMKGSEVIWVPSLDHAGIATQVVVERHLMKQKNQTRNEIGKEQFLNEVWKWKNEKGDTINEQLRTLGASLDWSKESFTMNDNYTDAINEAISRLWDAGLLFREPALVNWCCFLQSAISDIEVEEKEIVGPTDVIVPGYQNPVQFGLLTDFAYKFLNSGAVKVTPAHDSTDFEIAKRHNLPVIPVINEEGCLNDFLHCPFSGMKRFDARTAILDELKNQGLFRGHHSHSYKLPICSRSGDVIEYLLRPQWFVDCRLMAKKAIAALKNGELVLHPERFHKIWLSWLENIRQWNISRQIWWGHQIPLYEVSRKKGNKVPIWVVANSVTEAESKSAAILKACRSDLIIKQDPDVLDTWFSSGLLPFTLFGWPSESQDLEKYYPLNLMVTGHDILFFWVARMVMLGLQLTGKLPFNKIFLHGIICDSLGRKMSKSLGNVISPEDIIKGVSIKVISDRISSNRLSDLISSEEEKKSIAEQKSLFPNGIPSCGIDALRFTLASQNMGNQFINFDVDECIKNRSFCNKIWQAFRYVFGRMSQLNYHMDSNISNISFELDKLLFIDKWILSRLSYAVEVINTSLSDVKLDEATSAFRRFFHFDFCDVYLEYTKAILNEGLTDYSEQTLNILFYCLDNSLRIMSPFMPYLSEELNMWMPGTEKAPVMLSKFPSDLKEYRNPELENEINIILGLITVIRRIKVENNLLKKSTTVEITSEKLDLLKKHNELLRALVKDELILLETVPEDKRSNIVVEPYSYHTHVYVHIEGESKLSEDQIQLLLKKEVKINKELNKFLNMMNHKGYKEKAPLNVQLAQKEKVQGLQKELTHIKRKLELYGIKSDRREG
ncbi:valine--tRNA ligase-like isoform X2 [Lycorma delicatula]|uniref:valine--tRNA ligase-like isoform X2 n=1 Tax=Lycorma delicatula TaxID=130591 RepID=UPI003F512425